MLFYKKHDENVMDLYWYILHKNLAACLVIVAILAARLILKKAPKKTICLLWAVLPILFVLPPFIETTLPVLPERIITAQEADHYEAGFLEPVRLIPEDHYEFVIAVESGIVPQMDETGKQFVAVREDSFTNPRRMQFPWLSLFYWLWIAGMIGGSIYGISSYVAIRQKTAQSIEIGSGTYICDMIDSPFALGVFRPCIFLPSGLEKSYYPVICRHEKMHIQRGDLVWKWLGFTLLVINWFNPLAWVAYQKVCEDMENACDERATESLGKEEKGLYCEALLECGLKQRSVFIAPLYFGETNVLGRVKSILHDPSPLKWMQACLIAIGVMMVGGMMLKPQAQSVAEENSYDSLWSGERNYLDTRLGTFAEAKRNEANAKWDGETEIPGVCDFLGEIKLLAYDGKEVELAVYRQFCTIMGQNLDYIWWAQRVGDTFTAARDTGILWQAPGLSDFYSYFGTGTLSEFTEKVLQPRFNMAFDVVYNTIQELDLSEHQIRYPERHETDFIYSQEILNRKLQSYAEACRETSYSKWDGETEIPKEAQCLGEVWLEFGNRMEQYLLYSQKAVLQGEEYHYLWWASDSVYRGALPYERIFSQASDAGVLWQAPGLSETYSYGGLANLEEFRDQILMPRIQSGLDVVYNTVKDLEVTEYSVVHPPMADEIFVYKVPVINKMLASFAEQKRVESNAKWDGTSEIAGKSTCLGEIFLKFNTDQIHYVLYDQQARFKGQEFHYIWWCRSFREQENENTCYREYHDCREDEVIWQVPGLPESYGYFGCEDLENFKSQVLMKYIADTYDVIYNSVSSLDLTAYTYPREEHQQAINEEQIKAEKVESVLKSSAQYADPELGAYSMEKRRTSLMKWDFVQEIPVKCEYMGEVQLQGNGKTSQFMLFRQYADLNEKMFCFIWWTRKDGSGSEATYSEAKDTGLLWHPEELDEYFSYYGVENEQEFIQKVLSPELQSGMKVTMNTIKELKVE